MSEWQPIETAPKDGRQILVVWGIGRPQLVVSWDDEPHNPNYPWSSLDGLHYHKEAFSHWMPLPVLPKESKPCWQPIETAPRDGTNIIAWGDVMGSEGGYGRLVRTGPIVVYWAGEGWGPWRLSDGAPLHAHPFYWMPVETPDPPRSET